MAVSRIEELIEDIYDFVEECKMQPLSSTKVIVPKDELYDLLDELRLRTPDEIQRYKKMIENKDAILQDAEAKANAMLAYAQADQIVQQAQMQAEQILSAAENDANQIRTGAISYTSDMLIGLENIMDKAYSECRGHYEGLMHSMQENMEIVRANHRELSGVPEPTPAEEPQASNMEQESEPQEVVKHEGIIDDYSYSDEY